MTQVCSATGLAFVDGPVHGYGITKSSYGPLNPLARTPSSPDRSSWSRFDTPGSTVYLAGDRRTAYAETLAVARVANDFRNAIAFAAEQFDVTVEEASKMVQDDWTRNGNMVPGWLPASWRDLRRPESMAAFTALPRANAWPLPRRRWVMKQIAATQSAP